MTAGSFFYYRGHHATIRNRHAQHDRLRIRQVWKAISAYLEETWMKQEPELRWIQVEERFYCIVEDENPIGVVYPVGDIGWACDDLRSSHRRTLVESFASAQAARQAFEVLIQAELRPMVQPPRQAPATPPHETAETDAERELPPSAPPRRSRLVQMAQQAAEIAIKAKRQHLNGWPYNNGHEI
jgi:hypothetical protein